MEDSKLRNEVKDLLTSWLEPTLMVDKIISLILEDMGWSRVDLKTANEQMAAIITERDEARESYQINMAELLETKAELAQANEGIKLQRIVVNKEIDRAIKAEREWDTRAKVIAEMTCQINDLKAEIATLREGRGEERGKEWTPNESEKPLYDKVVRFLGEAYKPSMIRDLIKFIGDSFYGLAEDNQCWRDMKRMQAEDEREERLAIVSENLERALKLLQAK
jgi:hypothetical protein